MYFYARNIAPIHTFFLHLAVYLLDLRTPNPHLRALAFEKTRCKFPRTYLTLNSVKPPFNRRTHCNRLKAYSVIEDMLPNEFSSRPLVNTYTELSLWLNRSQIFPLSWSFFIAESH